MRTIDFREYCEYREFEEIFSNQSESGDTLTDYYEDTGREAYAWKNEAGCLLALWYKDNGEYVTF